MANKLQLQAFDDWFETRQEPLVIAGPCSVESEEQMLTTARQIADGKVASALRGGVWKPRTSPGSFEGIGRPALAWLKKAGEQTNLPVITEVATASQVEDCLEAGIDMLWIGARTTVNPFYVQELAEALRGVDIPVFVKNPIHPEVKLWLGALERFNKVGLNKLAAIHRGFYAYRSEPFRNEPKWELFFELRRLAPDLQVICDPSHIAGKRALLHEVCQSALDLGMDGFMIESHCQPEKALSDAAQQVTPDGLTKLIRSLETRHEFIDDRRVIDKLEDLRAKIDDIDHDIIHQLRERIQLARQIGLVKDENEATIFQMKRWFKVLDDRKKYGSSEKLNEEFIHELFQLIHKYSINEQIDSHRK